MLRNAAGQYVVNPAEPPFSPAELEHAADLLSRNRMGRRPENGGKMDRCPHTPECPNVIICIEEVAWFIRHHEEIRDLEGW